MILMVNHGQEVTHMISVLMSVIHGEKEGCWQAKVSSCIPGTRQYSCIDTGDPDSNPSLGFPDHDIDGESRPMPEGRYDVRVDKRLQ
jgi:hypothetical protein